MYQPDLDTLAALHGTVLPNDQTLAMVTVVLLYLTLFSAVGIGLVRRWL